MAKSTVPQVDAKVVAMIGELSRDACIFLMFKASPANAQDALKDVPLEELRANVRTRYLGGHIPAHEIVFEWETDGDHMEKP